MHLEGARVVGLTVGAPVGVSKEDASVAAALDDERATVRGAMMSAADGNEISCLVRAALGAEVDMMQVEEDRVFAAGHAAVSVIAQEHRPSQGG